MLKGIAVIILLIVAYVLIERTNKNPKNTYWEDNLNMKLAAAHVLVILFLVFFFENV